MRTLPSASASVRSAVVRVAVVSAAIQIGYGVLAIVSPYPQITASRYEWIWGVINLGMAAAVWGWLRLDVARPARVAAVAAVVAVSGQVLRAVVSAVAIVRPRFDVDPFIVVAIGLMFSGMVALALCSLHSGRRMGWKRWSPMGVAVTGMIAAGFYSTYPIVHFILLGLLWGPAWLLLSVVIAQENAKAGGKRIPPYPDRPDYVVTGTVR